MRISSLDFRSAPPRWEFATIGDAVGGPSNVENGDSNPYLKR
jgi:hypothetical protein